MNAVARNNRESESKEWICLYFLLHIKFKMNELDCASKFLHFVKRCSRLFNELLKMNSQLSRISYESVSRASMCDVYVVVSGVCASDICVCVFVSFLQTDLCVFGCYRLWTICGYARLSSAIWPCVHLYVSRVRTSENVYILFVSIRFNFIRAERIRATQHRLYEHREVASSDSLRVDFVSLANVQRARILRIYSMFSNQGCPITSSRP